MSARWVKSYWDEEDVTFYWGVGVDGWVTRHVELVGPSGTPQAAAALDEWFRELPAGRIAEYQRVYGHLADRPIVDWDFPHEDLTQAEYEAVWERARRHLESQR